ncbi:MAG: lipopolysaccharide heptosyltransferase II [Candidatus Omnitrophota bacterium]
MNILQVVSKLDTSDSAQDVIAATRFLTLNGHKVVVAAQWSTLVKQIDEVGARYYGMPATQNILFVPFAIYRLYKIILRENVQIVHSRDPISAFISFFASRLSEKTFVATIYDYHKRNFSRRAQFWAKRIICFSESDAHILVKRGLALQDKIRVIPPFVEDGTSTGQHRSYNKAGTPEGTREYRSRFVVEAALPLSSQEATQSFIKAVSILSRTIHKMKVFVINSASLHEKDSVEKMKLLITRHSLNNVVTYLPYGKDDLLAPEINLFVQVNTEENLSVRYLLLAQARGIPVVTTHVDRIKDFTGGNRTAVVCNRDNPQEMASKMLDLYRNEELQRAIVGEAKSFVSENFNIKKVMKTTLDLYEDVVASRNILVIKIGALGDVILAAPSIKALRKKFTGATIKLLVGMEHRDIYSNSPYIDEIIVYDFKQRDSGISGILRIARRLRGENFDMVVDFQNNKKSHLLSFLSCCPKRYGYDNGKLSFLLNRKIKDKKIPTGPIEHQEKVLALLGIYNIDKKLELWPSKKDEEWADSFLKSHWVTEGTKLVAFNIGSSPRWMTKLWPLEYFADVSNRLTRNLGIRVMLIGSESRDPRAEEFMDKVKCRPIMAMGKTSISKLVSLIKRCDLLLSSDSAPMHIAAGTGTPFVALFGPTDPARHVPPAMNYRVIKKDIPCAPCYSASCDKGIVCMSEIRPEKVYRSILKLLEIK